LRSDIVYGNLIVTPCWLLPPPNKGGRRVIGAPGVGVSIPPIGGNPIGSWMCFPCSKALMNIFTKFSSSGSILQPIHK
jgi:hypothetical protein